MEIACVTLICCLVLQSWAVYLKQVVVVPLTGTSPTAELHPVCYCCIVFLATPSPTAFRALRQYDRLEYDSYVADQQVQLGLAAEAATHGMVVDVDLAAIQKSSRRWAGPMVWSGLGK